MESSSPPPDQFRGVAQSDPQHPHSQFPHRLGSHPPTVENSRSRRPRRNLATALCREVKIHRHHLCPTSLVPHRLAPTSPRTLNQLVGRIPLPGMLVLVRRCRQSRNFDHHCCTPSLARTELKPDPHQVCCMRTALRVPAAPPGPTDHYLMQRSKCPQCHTHLSQ